ncbi:MAG TPA: hypothetical protein VKU00_07895 [Chthonomonadaceae bacterium]|nr:hypothetical protein [Chthonomonadaceae bacterium]
MRGSIARIIIGLILALSSGATLAQNGGNAPPGAQRQPELKPPSFPILFPNPTNNNGYEEWVKAADLIQNNDAIDTATEPGATLTLKRRVLMDRDVVQALELLHEGLKKPIVSPHHNLDENTLLPELAPFRKLARLLSTEMYVQFADGRVDAAIDSLRDGLAFGYYIQMDTLISGLVGLAVDAIVLNQFARHFDQISVHQCDQVSRLVEGFLKAENPAVHLLAMEKSYALQMLEIRRSDPNALLDLLPKLSGGTQDPQTTLDIQRIEDHLATQPGGLSAMIDEAQAHVNALYGHALLNLSLPLSERKPFVPDKSRNPGSLLAQLISVDPERIADKYSINQAQLRLLGLHALIHRYRWEHNALPGSLVDLHADHLVIDPFTGDQIRYERSGDQYKLYSAGPLARNDDGTVLSKERTPVQLIK